MSWIQTDAAAMPAWTVAWKMRRQTRTILCATGNVMIKTMLVWAIGVPLSLLVLLRVLRIL
jgi:hypothetical protein